MQGQWHHFRMMSEILNTIVDVFIFYQTLSFYNKENIISMDEREMRETSNWEWQLTRMEKAEMLTTMSKNITLSSETNLNWKI